MLVAWAHAIVGTCLGEVPLSWPWGGEEDRVTCGAGRLSSQKAYQSAAMAWTRQEADTMWSSRGHQL
jgi:hypothetical protein